jgi:hypothetical protein
MDKVTYIKNFHKLRVLLVAILFLVVGNKSWGQTTVSYTGMGTITCNAVPTATISPSVTGLTFSQLSRGSGVTCASASTGISGSGFNVTLANALTGSKWYTYSITSDATVSFTISSFSIVSQVSSAVAGNSIDVQYSIGGGAKTSVGSFTPTASSAAYTITPGSAISVGASQTVDIFFVPNNLSAAGTTCRINNNTSVNVTTTPTCTSPTTQATSFTASSVTSSTMTIGWTRGNGNNVLVIAKASGAPTDPSSGTNYTANAAYGSGTAVGGGFAVYNGTGASVNLTGLSPNTSYNFAIYEYNTTSTCYNLTELTGSQSTTCNDPTTQASTITTSSITGTTATINFTNGNGSNRLVVVKSGSAVAGAPVDGTSYTANTAFGSGSTIAANEFVVYANTGSSVSITGLTGGTTYYISVFEYNNTSNCYLSTSPATANFTAVSGTSDIIAVASSEAVTISSVINTSGPLTSLQGVQVWQFTIRDGGGSNDADVLSTIVNQIVFSQAAGDAVGNWTTAIQAIDLFDGVTNVGSGTVAASTVTFSGLNINVADNTSKTITVRLTLKCPLGAGNLDGDDFGFQISNSNVTFSATGSGKSAFSSISTLNGQNAIAVVSTALIFSLQPSTTSVNQSMSSITVTATDACGNTDLGFTGTISLTSTGNMTGSPITAAAVAGVATFSSITHTVTATGLTLTASSSGLTNATSNTFDIIVTTIFNPGDFAIIAVNTQVLSSGSADEVCFVTFEDIQPGTSFDLTDNGFERITAGKWGNTEGTFRFTRKASATTIPKGTVICVNGPDATFNDADINLYNIYVCGAYDDNNWTLTNLSSYYGLGQFDLNSSDQVWILQGGTWTDGTTSNSHDATHSGTMMYGWTATGWMAGPNYASTSGSTMYPNMTCFTTDVAATTNKSKVKYTGPMTATTRLGWISRINTTANWSGYLTNALYDGTVGAYDYNLINAGSTCSDITFNLSSTIETDGLWTGAKDINWFNCANWQTLKVPDSTVNVQIDNVTNDPIIGASPTLYPNGAVCNDLSITNTAGAGVLTLNNSLSYLSIKGNIINNGVITATNGLTDLRSANAQTFSGSGTTGFYNLRLNNTNALGVSLAQDVSVANLLTFTNGMLNTGTNKLIITNPTVPTISGYTSSKFINGNLRHFIGSNTSTYVFPIGDGMTSSNYKRLDLVNNNLTGVNYIDAYVNAVTETSPNDDATFATAGQFQNNSPLWYVMENAQWDLTPDAAPTGNSYGVRLYTANTGLTSADDNSFCPVKRPSASTTYADWVSLESSTTIPASGTAGRIYNSGLGYAQRLGYTTFSKHAIAKSTGPLPIELLTFTAKYNGNNAVDLKWATATEINNDYFTIERSLDAISFKPINTVDGAGNSTIILNYSDVDKNPNKGLNYYRLKQTDFNGKTSYSPIVSVDVQSIFSASIYPNPVTSELHIKLSTDSKEPANFEIINLQGVTLDKTKVQISEEGVYSIDLQSYAAGAYILKATVGNETKQTLFIKQ